MLLLKVSWGTQDTEPRDDIQSRCRSTLLLPNPETPGLQTSHLQRQKDTGDSTVGFSQGLEVQDLGFVSSNAWINKKDSIIGGF